MKAITLIFGLFPFLLNAQLFISQGADFVLTDDAELTIVEMNFENHGNFQAGNSKVIFKEIGGGTDIEIFGTQTPTFRNIDFDLQNQKVVLISNIEINGDIEFINGCVNLNNFNCILGIDAMLNNENNGNSFITTGGGQIIQTANLNTPNNVNVGNLGAVITSTENLGNVTIRRGHDPQNSGSNESIKRYFEIEPENNQNLNATLRFYYLESELNGIPENELDLWRESFGVWEDMGFSLRNPTQNYVALTGIDHFSKWTLTNDANALPVELSYFRATKLEENKALLEWQTLAETNNEGFEIQRADDRFHWKKIGFVKGIGNSNQSQTYDFLDTQPLMGTNYYRLRQIDLNGTESFSEIKTLLFGKKDFEVGTPFPNPISAATQHLQIPIYSSEVTSLEISIFDNLGRLIQQSAFENLTDNQIISIKIQDLASGIYYLNIENENTISQKRFVKK